MNLHKISQTTELWCVKEFLEKNNKNRHNLEAKEGGQAFVAHRLYLINIPIKLHEDIRDSE